LQKPGQNRQQIGQSWQKGKKGKKKNSYRATLFHRVGVAVNVAELVAWRKEEKEEEGREALW
jgi:hypothetical protein